MANPNWMCLHHVLNIQQLPRPLLLDVRRRSGAIIMPRAPGRPKLSLTDEERRERTRVQDRARQRKRYYE
jgi:hypothetical protein